jgi:AraC-like DNA-binding protein
MELNLPYINPVNFAGTLVNNYGFSINEAWNSHQLKLPDNIGDGILQLFIRKDIHFFRGKWKFLEDTTFLSRDPVGQKGLIDFRLNKEGHIHSSFIEGIKKFEWEITETDGIRFFIPEAYLNTDKHKLTDQFEKYCNNQHIINLQKQIFSIPNGQVSNTILLESKMLEFIYFWMDSLKTNDLERHFEGIADSRLIALDEARALIEADTSNALLIKNISRKVGLNEFDLKRDFRKVYGLPLHQYKIKFRMEQAQELIRNTDLPIQEICNRLGYTNRFHFSQLYERFFGTSPSIARTILIKKS